MNKRFNKYIISVFSKLFKDSYQELIKNDPLRMAGATAFFTTFALPPILIIIIQALSLIFNTGKISKKLFQDLSEIIGKESMQQVIETLIGFRKLAHNWYLTILGFLFLLFVATTLFLVIKRSLNQLWKIRLIKKQSFWTKMRGRIN